MRSSQTPGAMKSSQRRLRSQGGLGTSLQTPTRRRSRYSAQRRLEVAKVRKVGACDDCRRKKVGCSHALQHEASAFADPGSPPAKKEVDVPFRFDLDMLPGPRAPSNAQEKERHAVINGSAGAYSQNANSGNMESQSQPQSMISSNERWGEAEPFRVDQTSTSGFQIAPITEGSHGNHEYAMTYEESAPWALSPGRDATPALSWVSSPASHRTMLNGNFSVSFDQPHFAKSDSPTARNASPYYAVSSLSPTDTSPLGDEGTHTGAYVTAPMAEYDNASHLTQLVSGNALPNDVVENAGYDAYQPFPGDGCFTTLSERHYQS
ncbi:hypothetical protein BDZ45DRAFT_687377 [Acephala macrosclerotiorum]|nr:hypothetical protein BDZ45DRAFT_687377 [Acephala macrosclerotiorum]